MKEFKRMTPYVLICAAAFYLLPLLGNSTGSFITILLIVIPLTCFATSFLYGHNNGWNFIFPIIIAVIFIPTIFIYFNSTAWVYSVVYSLIAAVGVLIGKTLKNK
jgi:Ca2+/Na+ antiporter